MRVGLGFPLGPHNSKNLLLCGASRQQNKKRNETERRSTHYYNWEKPFLAKLRTRISNDNTQSRNPGTPRNTFQVSKVSRNISKCSITTAPWQAGLAKKSSKRQFMKSQNPQSGGLEVNLRQIFHQSMVSLFYTPYWGIKVFPAASLSPKPLFP